MEHNFTLKVYNTDQKAKFQLVKEIKRKKFMFSLQLMGF